MCPRHWNYKELNVCSTNRHISVWMVWIYTASHSGSLLHLQNHIDTHTECSVLTEKFPEAHVLMCWDLKISILSHFIEVCMYILRMMHNTRAFCRDLSTLRLAFDRCWLRSVNLQPSVPGVSALPGKSGIWELFPPDMGKMPRESGRSFLACICASRYECRRGSQTNRQTLKCYSAIDCYQYDWWKLIHNLKYTEIKYAKQKKRSFRCIFRCKKHNRHITIILIMVFVLIACLYIRTNKVDEQATNMSLYVSLWHICWFPLQFFLKLVQNMSFLSPLDAKKLLEMLIMLQICELYTF